MTTSARQNPEASEYGKLFPSHPGLPQLPRSGPAWTACLQALPWLHDAWASAPPRFPTGASRPQCGAHPVSLTRTGTGPQTHRNMIPAAPPSALFSYFYFQYIILYSFVKSNHWIQSNVAVLTPRVIIFQESPLPSAGSAASQYPLPVSRGASGAHARVPSSPATRRWSESPAGSPQASALGCRCRCW